jgi:PAS domain S-box-containing protein
MSFCSSIERLCYIRFKGMPMESKRTDLSAYRNLLALQPNARNRDSGTDSRAEGIYASNEYSGKADGSKFQPGETNFRAIAENANDGIMINSTVAGPYVYANQRASDISGYPIPELLQLGPQDLLPPMEYVQVRKVLERRFQGRKIPERYETEIVRKDGCSIPVEISGSNTIWQGDVAFRINPFKFS